MCFLFGFSCLFFINEGGHLVEALVTGKGCPVSGTGRAYLEGVRYSRKTRTESISAMPGQLLEGCLCSFVLFCTKWLNGYPRIDNLLKVAHWGPLALPPRMSTIGVASSGSRGLSGVSSLVL